MVVVVVVVAIKNDNEFVKVRLNSVKPEQLKWLKVGSLWAIG